MTKKMTFLLFIAMFFFPVKAFALTLEVPSQYGSIKDAVKAASVGDRIEVAPGTYYGNIEIRKNIELVSTGGSSQTILDGQNSGSVVRFANAQFDGVTVPRIAGFTIRGGNSVEGQGGGITLQTTDVIIEDNIITSNNSKMDGGGILINQDSQAILRRNSIVSNTAKRFGGGIFIVGASHPLLYENTISNNSAQGAVVSAGGPSGGGIFVDGNSSPQIVNNLIEDNEAEFAGGGISLRVGSASVVEGNTISRNKSAYGGGLHIETEGTGPKITSNTITNNQANLIPKYSGSGYGGGISIYNRSTPIISDNTISENFAAQGGGGIVSSENADSVVTGNTISNNSTTTSSGYYEGGGIYVASSTMRINNNAIYLNGARLGGGVALLDGAIVTIQNNTIVKNISPYTPERPSGGGIFVRSLATSANIVNNIITQNQEYQIFEETKRASFRFNMVNNDSRGIYYNWNSGAITNIANLDASSLIDASDNFSGIESFQNPTGNDFRLTMLSEAIDKSGIATLSSYDRRGFFRTGTKPDVGAYEYTTASSSPSLVYRFWSDTYKHHFFTISKSERDQIMSTYKNKEWRYEGIAFRAYTLTDCSSERVYRFWSDTYRGHFYTISSAEKNLVISSYPDNVWRYEGEAYCAKSSSSVNAVPLYRFWSDTYNGHFYTASSAEKNFIIQNYPSNIWRYEQVGYYVYPEV